eukprot:2155575-Rhodomonas_salina.1
MELRREVGRGIVLDRGIRLEKLELLALRQPACCADMREFADVVRELLRQVPRRVGIGVDRDQ